jgi:hypothetical protein
MHEYTHTHACVLTYVVHPSRGCEGKLKNKIFPIALEDPIIQKCMTLKSKVSFCKGTSKNLKKKHEMRSCGNIMQSGALITI